MALNYTNPATGSPVATTVLADSTNAQVMRLDVGTGSAISAFTGAVTVTSGSVGITGTVASTQSGTWNTGTVSPDNVATAQVSVTTSATLIAAARAGRRSITVEQLGTTAVYLGATGVTTATGVLLPGTVGSSVTLNFTGALYGIVATGTQTVAEFELY